MKNFIAAILLLTALSSLGFADDNEHLSIGVDAGASLPLTIGGVDFSAFPTVGFNLEYKLIPWFGVGVSTQESLFIPKDSSNLTGTIVEGAFTPQVLFYAGNTGFYAGVRGGLNTMFDTLGDGHYLFGFVWGPKIGYQYHFAGGKFAIGPEYSAMFSSSASYTDSSEGFGSSTVKIPSHTSHNISVLLKWWLF